MRAHNIFFKKKIYFTANNKKNKQNKSGLDYPENAGLVEGQVDTLINEATRADNLCQSYVGWLVSVLGNFFNTKLFTLCTVLVVIWKVKLYKKFV